MGRRRYYFFFLTVSTRTQHFARSAKRREEKNKAPVTSPLFWLFRPPAPTTSSTAIAGKWFPYDRYDRCDAIVANLKLVNQAFS